MVLIFNTFKHFKANLLNFKATTTEERTLLQPENKDSKYFFKCNISLP